MRITEDLFRKTLGLFPTGVTVVTAPCPEAGDIGITISSFTSVSLNPPQILFCLSKASTKIKAIKSSRYFAVNILADEHSHISDGFANRSPLAWETLKTTRHKVTGCLLLEEAMGHVICEKAAIYDGADHEIILGKVIDLHSSPHTQPLIRHRGQYLTTQSVDIETPGEFTYRKAGCL